MANKTWAVVAGVGVLALAGAGAWMYSSPYRTLDAMHEAVQARDADAFNVYVDYPAVQSSIKSQVASHLTQAMQQNGADPQQAAAAQALGMAMVGGLVDNLVSPSTVEKALEGPPPAPKRRAAPLPKPEMDPSMDPHAMREKLEKEVSFEAGYRDFDTFDITLKHKQNPGEFVIVMKRSGLTQWKVSGVELPKDMGFMR